MGKVDELRRMREARFAAARATTPAAAPRPAAARTAPALAAPAPQPVAPEAESDALCGHRSIGNKSCTREKDHQKTGTKNHRYG